MTSSAPDTSLPDAVPTFAAQDGAEMAKALAVAAQAKGAPPKNMTKEQATKSMPFARQANIHSALVRDNRLAI